MQPVTQAIEEHGRVDSETFERQIAMAYRPVVLRGQVADWPAVAAGNAGPRSMADYILRFDIGSPVEVMIGPPEAGGRFWYSDDMRRLNFQRKQVPLGPLLAELIRLQDEPKPPALYAGAAAAGHCLPGWDAANPLPLPTPDAQPRIWIGNATRVATHYDISSNIACVIAGRRRFTLFPPEQIGNLYVGPLEWTLAGQPTSMVDLDAPDLDKFPRFAEALKHALTAELGPGDALFIPSLWWHNVAALDPFNVLLNYWWGQVDETPAFAALVHALLSIRDVARPERDAWRVWFDHYVFGEGADEAGQHIPPHAQGVLGPSHDERTRKMKDYLIRALSRR